MAASPTGQGYWLTVGDGTTYAFGDAVFKGPANGAGDLSAATRRVVSVASSPSGQGYWHFTAAGYALAFGDAGDIPGAAGSVTPLVGAAVVPLRSASAVPVSPTGVPATPLPPPPPLPPPSHPSDDGVCNGKLPTDTTLDAHGQPGPAFLKGTSKDDVIIGSAGDDVIEGGGG